MSIVQARTYALPLACLAPWPLVLKRHVLSAGTSIIGFRDGSQPSCDGIQPSWDGGGLSESVVQCGAPLPSLSGALCRSVAATLSQEHCRPPYTRPLSIPPPWEGRMPSQEGRLPSQNPLICEVIFSSESECHPRAIIFRRVPSGRKKRNAIVHNGVPRGSSEKRHFFDLVLLCMGSLHKCHIRAGAKGSFEGTPRYT